MLVTELINCLSSFEKVRAEGAACSLANKFSDDDILKRYVEFYGDERIYTEGLVPSLRQELSSLSEFMREIKVNFARFYNRRHNQRGYFWGDRFKSVIVENGETLIKCLAYIDLNPLRREIRGKLGPIKL